MNHATVSASDTPTVRMRPPQRVVLVRDDERPWRPLADVLMTAFVVRLAVSVSDMLRYLQPLDRLACVCVASDTICLRTIHAAFKDAGGASERIVFVAEGDVASPAALDAFLRVVLRLGAERA